MWHNITFWGKVLPHLCLLDAILRVPWNNVTNYVKIYLGMLATLVPPRNWKENPIDIKNYNWFQLLFINKQCLHLCSAMFVGCIWLNYKPYKDFWNPQNSFYGAIRERTMFLAILFDYLYSLALKIIIIGACHMCRK